jgi:hypothetical protein
MPILAAKTIAADLRYSPGHRRKWTGARVRASLKPRLDDMVFVVGAPRSGTTFLGEVLAAVPEFSYHFEPVITKAAAPYVYAGVWDRERSARFFRRTYRWLARFRFDGDLRQVDKTPRNAMIVPFLAEAFPDARFVHIIRDGRDVAYSWSRRPWLAPEGEDIGRHEPGGYRYGPFARFWVEPERIDEFEASSTAHRCAWGWRRHVASAREAGRSLLQHRYLEVRYEALVTDPAAVGRSILDFLAVPEASRTGAFDMLAGAHRETGGRWRDDLGPRELGQVDGEIGDLLAELGY